MPISLTLGKRRPLAALSELPDLSSTAPDSQADDGARTQFPQAVVRTPAFLVDIGASPQRQWTSLATVIASLTLLAGPLAYWHLLGPTVEPQPPALAQPKAPEPTSQLVQSPPASVVAPSTTPEEIASEPRFAIRMATFQSRARMEQALQEFREAGFKAYSVEGTLSSGARAFAVFLGPYTDRAELDRTRDRAQEIPGYGSGFIVRVE